MRFKPPIIPPCALLYQHSALHLCLESSPLSSLSVILRVLPSGRAVCEENTVRRAGLPGQLCRQLRPIGGLWGSTSRSQPHLRRRTGRQHERWTVWLWSGVWWRWGACQRLKECLGKISFDGNNFSFGFLNLSLCVCPPSRTVTWFSENTASTSARLTLWLWSPTTSSASHISSTQGWGASPAACPPVQPSTGNEGKGVVLFEHYAANKRFQNKSEHRARFK